MGVQNYNMHSMGKTILALHAMLKLTEKGMPKKALAVLAIRQAAWTLEDELSSVFGRVKEEQSNDRPMDMYCDNIGAITIADEHGVQKDNNLAHPFTKSMSCTKHVEHARNIGLRPAGSFM
ncbi:hypothetical protein Tco_1373613 [Tanacetum coccineum]